jgi:DNA-binding FadR family transcriptional regulator
MMKRNPKRVTAAQGGTRTMRKSGAPAPAPAAFRAARQSRIFQDVVEQIQEAILRGEFQPGDKLPAERELKEMFQTSRGTLREALRVLEQKGLIEIRLGVNGGAVVRASMDQPLTESLGLMLRLQEISLTHLHEFREEIEGAVTATAARQATAEDIQNLEQLVDNAARCVAKGTAAWDDFLRADKRFHQTLARITRNPIYIYMYNVVHDNIQPYYDRFLPADPELMRENHQDLRDILDAVRAGTVALARKRAQAHVRRFGEHMKRYSTA